MRHIRYIILLIGIMISTVSCQRTPVGYLHADNAEFVPDRVTFYHTASPLTPRGSNPDIPWTTLRIQGVAGTNPINYQYVSVRIEEGSRGDAEAFEQMVRQGAFTVDGGLIQITQAGVRALPVGSYVLSLRVFNEGHTRLLTDIITIDIAENQPIE